MIIRNKDELNKIKTAAKINREILAELQSICVEGITGKDVEQRAFELFKKNSVTPAFLGYCGYPSCINFMINNQVIHCIPSKYQVVKSGDLVSIDSGCIYGGLYSDQAISFGIGEVKEDDEKLLNIGELSVEAGCNQAIADHYIGDIGFAQQATIELAGFSVVKNFVGHEIGRDLHERLKIPAFGTPRTGERLKENMLICIENQVCAKSPEVYTDKGDGWSTYTKDGGNCVTFEHMVIIGKDKPNIITKI